MVVGELTCCALLDLKAAQMNMQCRLIQELMLNEFKLVHNAAEATKNICCVKGEGTVDYNTVTRWFKKFCLGYKNCNDQVRLGRPKTMDSEDLLQAIEANLVSSTWSVSGKFRISQWFITFITSAKAPRAIKLGFTLLKYCKTFDTSKYLSWNGF